MSRNIQVACGEGRHFDCYLALPEATQRAPAIVLASTIHGVDEDMRAISDAFALRGYVAAAPDLFWRTVPGPLPRGDARSVQRAQPRRANIRTGEADLAAVLLSLRGEARCNGRAIVMGFCYGGPYAVIGPARLGYDAGVACHGSQMLDVLEDLETLRRPVHVLWGDRDRMAPAPVLAAYRSAAGRSLTLHVFPGVQHGYMLRSSAAFDASAFSDTMACALALLQGLHAP